MTSHLSDGGHPPCVQEPPGALLPRTARAFGRIVLRTCFYTAYSLVCLPWPVDVVEAADQLTRPPRRRAPMHGHPERVDNRAPTTAELELWRQLDGPRQLRNSAL